MLFRVDVRTTGTLLVAAFVVFLVGAGFWLVREFERPLPEMLRAVHARRRRWMWIHAWLVAGTLVGVVAEFALYRLLHDNGGGLLALIAFVAFAGGSLGFLITLAFRLTATPRAAAQTVVEGAVPSGYPRGNRLATVTYSIHMVLSYAAFALFGLAMLGGSLLPGWLGWTGVVLGVVCGAGFIVTKGGPFAPPILVHSFGLLTGIVLLAL